MNAQQRAYQLLAAHAWSRSRALAAAADPALAVWIRLYPYALP